MSIFWNLGWFFKKHWLRYSFCVLFLILVSLAELLPPWIIGELVDEVQQDRVTFAMVLQSSLLIAFIGLAIYVLRNGWRIMLFGGAIELGRVMRLRLFHQFTHMSPEFYQRHNTGDLMAHATNDVKAIEMTAAEGVLTLVDSMIAGSAVIIAMILVCGWEMTVAALLPFPVMAWLMFTYSGLLHSRFKQAQEAFSDLNNRVQEAVSGVRAIRAHDLSSAQMQKFAHQSESTVAANMKVARVDAMFDPTISICVGISILGSMGFGAWRINSGLMTLGELTTFTIYLGLLIWPMFAFGWLFNIVERGNASLNRLQSLMGEKPGVTDKEVKATDSLDGDIRFDVKHFIYPGADKLALGKLELNLKKGQFIGICGRTGCGKSTLLRLLLRQYDDASVTIQINGIDHQQFSLDQLRSRFALVSQEPFLFSATIAENIAFGKPFASREEIERVARLACVHDDIVQFTEGYETLLGEKGVNLSGGQKQRLTIARALLLDAEVLLFDDAFCSLDMQTEARILDNLMKPGNTKTIVLITQRLTNLNRANQIVVLDDGVISESGSHRDLIAENGWYAKIFNRQALEIKASGINK
ncbi:ABC transporter transmembrane domain-containing protein [uncultured Endozoicomonas sp.]|uniref:ABC transporter transmembrane domain-containing protein n=1 Tax=uncultured Endozoicomonas sp. TaxID=432652 RepID=UPI002608B905|nr:ABC transporter transmembrane domain-containing protein [uncultured Endozoicomonas sp.]